MNYRQALNLTIEEFKLTGVQIARHSGIGENQISNYRTGKRDLTVASLECIISSLPIEAKLFFYSLVLQSISRTNHPSNEIGVLMVS